MRTRLDRVALGAIAALLVALVILVLRGDQVGALVVASSPASGASVSTRPALSLTFSEAMNPAKVESHLSLAPAMSYTLRWAGRNLFVETLAPLRPDTPYTLTLRAGALSQRGRVVRDDFSLGFKTRNPSLAYLAPASGAPNLWVSGADGSSPRQITSEAYGVFDFAVSLDGSKIALSITRNKDGIRDVWLVNPDGSGRERVVTCDNQSCQSVAWMADGTRLIFERRTMVEGAVGRTPGAARIWLYDVTSKETAPLSADNQDLGALPRPAPSGQQVAYYDSVNSVIALVDTQTGARQNIPSLLGDPGNWSPDATRLIFPDLSTSETGDFSRLFLANLAKGEIAPFAVLSAANDISAHWSPLGNAVAFTRQNRDVPVPSGSFSPIGPQIWVAGADGTEARQVTRDEEHSFGGLAWSPDGAWIAAVRINLLTPNSVPEVWLVKADGGEARMLAKDATLPAWVP